jgi:hypothetical protein
MVDTDGQEHYDVEYYDEWLEVDDFKSIPADGEEEALDEFWDMVDDEERYTIQNVERAFMIPNIIRDD